jgi:RNA polymerase sigma-70 factor (ECF subfamily)
LVDAPEIEPEYVQRLSSGDRQAEHEFAVRFEPLLRMKVRVRVRGASSAYVDDIVQETFARVFSALRAHKIEEPQRFGAFVNRVCENVMHEAHRTDRRVTTFGDSGPDVPSRDDPERTAAAREDAVTAGQLLGELPQRDREILELVLVAEADRDEVCRRFDVSRDHLRVLVHRARQRFGALLTLRRCKSKGGA